MNSGTLSDPSFIGSTKRPLMKKEATLKNAKGLVQRASDEKRGKMKKRKGSHSKGFR
jgi:hypothetical protein